MNLNWANKEQLLTFFDETSVDLIIRQCPFDNAKDFRTKVEAAAQAEGITLDSHLRQLMKHQTRESSAVLMRHTRFVVD